MVDYYHDDEDFQKRSSFKPIFWIVPLVVSFLIILVLVIVKLTSGGLSWGGVVGWSFFVLVSCWGLSILIYLLTSIKESKSSEREFNSPQKCDELLRDLIVRDTGYVLDDFSKTAESVFGSRWAGEGESSEQERVYFHLYRGRIGALSRYLIAVINMDKKKSDSYVFKQSPSNFQNLSKEIDDLADSMCHRRKKMVTRERVYRDEVTGREETTREESPFDAQENGVDFDE